MSHASFQVIFAGCRDFIKSATVRIAEVEAGNRDLESKLADKSARCRELEQQLVTVKSAAASARPDEDTVEQAIHLCKVAGVIRPQQEEHFRRRVMENPNTALHLLTAALAKSAGLNEGKAVPRHGSDVQSAPSAMPTRRERPLC